MSYYIGVDIGTTHIKTGVFDETGEMLELYKRDTPIGQEPEGCCYLPQNLWEIVGSQLESAVHKFGSVKGIAVTGMAEAGLVMDTRLGTEKSNIIPWFDSRTVPYSQRTTPEEERENYQSTGLRNSFKYGIYKYLWLLEHNGWDKKDTMWLSVCDYIVWRLTGRLVTEPTFAARTYVYHIRQGIWDEKRINGYGLSVDNFPQVIPSGSAAGIWESYGIPVALCGHDHICCAFGALTEPGQLCNSMGTAETYIGLSKEFPATACDTGLVYGPFVDGEQYFALANFPSSGQSVEWLRKNLHREELSYEEFNESLENCSREPGEILYFPYLSGIGTPLFSSEVSAAFLGLRSYHESGDMGKAVVEGICYHSRWLLETVGYPKQEQGLVCVGGAVESECWMQYKADILDCDIVIPGIKEGTLLGAAALMLWKQEGIRLSFSRSSRDCTVYKPDPRLSDQYRKVYETTYRNLIPMICRAIKNK